MHILRRKQDTDYTMNVDNSRKKQNMTESIYNLDTTLMRNRLSCKFTNVHSRYQIAEGAERTIAQDS